jgi:hypothetical protein
MLPMTKCGSPDTDRQADQHGWHDAQTEKYLGHRNSDDGENAGRHRVMADGDRLASTRQPRCEQIATRQPTLDQPVHRRRRAFPPRQ